MLLLRGGRIVDPASGRDAVGDVLVVRGTVTAVGDDLPPGLVAGARVVDVTGLVVGPGLIDLHSHANTVAGHRLQALDGVTTTLELEAGLLPVELAYARTADEGRPLNFGFSASWAAARARVLLGHDPDATVDAVFAVLGEPGWQRDSTPAELGAWLTLIAGELERGALGIGLLIGYAPRTDPAEVLALAHVAAAAGAPTFAHVRELVEDDPDTPIDGAVELVEAAAATGAHMHHCHVNSTARRALPRVLGTIADARDAGLPVSVEAYPYGAGTTAIGAAFLAPERLAAWGISPTSLTVVESGERIATGARLRELRAEQPDVHVVVEFLDEADAADRALLDRALAHPGMIVASDALAPHWGPAGDSRAWPLPAGGRTHPRSAGTFAKALRRMVRETSTWTWLEAFRRCSLLPAQLLEPIAADATRKGRVAPGADADLVVLRPEAITDRATYADPTRPSEGVVHLLVGGTFVVRDGDLVPDAFPGSPLRGAPR